MERKVSGQRVPLGVRTSPFNRRTLLQGMGASALVGAAGPLGACSKPSEGDGGTDSGVDLDFVIWSYEVETVADNVKRFQQEYPDLSVKLNDFSWNRYHDTMVNRFNSETPTSVAYNGGDWLPEFAAAGWVVPLEDHFSWVKEYEDKTFGFAWEDMLYDGKVYGLPYYADTMSFLYNAKILEDAGISTPPETWEELTTQAKQLQAEGLDQPLIIELAQDAPQILEAFLSMAFGRGGEMIDEADNPLWADPAGAEAQQFNWLVKAATEDKILASVPHETDAVRAMQTGRHAFAVLYNYNLAELNNPARSDRAGEFQLALMPGETHECYGFAKFYNMTQMAADAGDDVVEACGRFIEYFSGETDGEYVVAKRWALDSGLGFGQVPLLDDPEVRDSLSAWMDLDVRREQLELARAVRHTVWYGGWSEFFRREYVQAMAGDKSPEEALEASATEWRNLKKQYES